MGWKELITDLGAKCVTVGMTFLIEYIAEGGYEFIFTGEPEAVAKVVLFVFAYGVWTKAIVPTVNGWLGGYQTTEARTKSVFDLI